MVVTLTVLFVVRLCEQSVVVTLTVSFVIRLCEQSVVITLTVVCGKTL